jgi:3-oxoacyl-[acyl-carrier-protein] synthase-3
VSPQDIDYILLCTQSPDYFLPTTACLLQQRLGIPTSAGALDFNLGSSGYVYGLGLAEGLIATGQALNILLLTADTYSKFIQHRDKSVRTIFGDAATATWLRAVDSPVPSLGPFLYGTDGRGGPNLIVPSGGMRLAHSTETAQIVEDENGNIRSQDNLFMNGAEIFSFTLQAVPHSVEALLAKSGLTADQIDLFVLHQPNRYMLEHLRKKMKLPVEKFPIYMSHCGDTVSCTIPIVLKHASQDGLLRSPATVMLVGFGVGYSWGATLLRWNTLSSG